MANASLLTLNDLLVWCPNFLLGRKRSEPQFPVATIQAIATTMLDLKHVLLARPEGSDPENSTLGAEPRALTVGLLKTAELTATTLAVSEAVLQAVLAGPRSPHMLF